MFESIGNYIQSIAEYLENLPVSMAISQGDWYFPGIESTHVLALSLVFGSISMVDLRLLNITLRNRSVDELTREVLPWTWVAYTLAAITGTLLFCSAATKYIHLWAFEAKMVCMALAGLNMLVFHFMTNRDIASWGIGKPPPLKARIAGGTSLVLWIGIVTFGRWTGFL